VVAGGWAGLLSRKYSRPTIGTTGSYQFSLRGQGHPTEVGGLYPPANKLAISAWEDPSELSIVPRPPGAKPPARPRPKVVPAAVPKAKPFLPDGPISRLVYRIYSNAIRYMGTLFRLSPLSPVILLGLLIACWNVPRGGERDRWVILIGTMLLYPAGYLLIFINERFFWLITFLLSLSAGLLTTVLPVLRRRPWSTCWAVVVAVSLSLWPAWLLIRLGHHVLEETPAGGSRLISSGASRTASPFISTPGITDSCGPMPPPMSSSNSCGSIESNICWSGAILPGVHFSSPPVR
jgi:hypothetical protein